MNRRSIIAAAAALLSQNTFSTVSRAHPTACVAADLQASLDTEVRRGAPGLAAAIIASDERMTWTGAAGLADVSRGIALSADQPMGIGSITKVFVAVVALQLVEEGKLDLSRTAADLLGSEIVAGIANAESATVAQLMQHVGGVPSWEDDSAWIREARGDRYDPRKSWHRNDSLDYLRSPGHAALNAPGAAFAYANTNYTLIGLLIEKVSGRRLESEIRRRILQPLKLATAYLEGFESHAGGVAPRRYHYATEEFRRSAGISPLFPEIRPGLIDVSVSRLGPEWAAGGLVMNVSDLAAFGQALRDGQLLKGQEMRFMTEWRALPSRNGEPPRAWVGHGLFRLGNANSGVVIGHGGDVLGSSAALYWSERGNALIAVQANVGTMHAGVTPPDAKSVATDSAFSRKAFRYARGE